MKAAISERSVLPSVRELDLRQPLPGLTPRNEVGGCRSATASILVRLASEPVGRVRVPVPPAGLSPDEFACVIWDALGGAINTCLERNGQPRVSSLDGAGLPGGEVSKYTAERDRVLLDAPLVSVILCTRDRVQAVESCVAALRAQTYPHFEIVVVDNAPSTDGLERALAKFSDNPPIRRVVEPVPGLSRARNCGLLVAVGEIVAYIDDDEVADRYWLAELARGFSVGDDVGCVTGMILPAELQTNAERWFEEFGGHSKGRGFEQEVFGKDRPNRQSPLYPLPPFGAGGNMAFRKTLLLALGGFDPALGAGSPARGGEDTAAFSDVLLSGRSLVYRPSALVWHRHHADLEGLKRQLYGYGVGLTAYYTRMIWRRPSSILEMVRLLPRGLKDMLGSSSVRNSTMSKGFPPSVRRAQRLGMAYGPIAYLRGVGRQHVRGGRTI